MRALQSARRFARSAPREALADLLGLAGVCALVYGGFVLPGLL